MGCGGAREKGPPEHSQQWSFITLSDFRRTSAWTPLAYIWLWCMGLVGIAVYAVDTFTAVNLLAFDKWNGQVQPVVPFKYSKWIFAACILLSWLLCFYEWFRAIRVIKRGGVAQSYMDPLAVTLQSIRPQGWRRFLVFTALTKSKKGADYIAFFVYFAFQSAVRIILAEGPRQAVNGMTLYSVMKADLIPSHGQHSNIGQFFLNVEELAGKQKEQAVILFSMLFTLVIWVFSALSLILATIFYLTFLWHYIPQRDGRLSIYCRRKIDRRLEKIVEHRVKEAILEEEQKKQKAEKKAELKRMKTGETLAPKQPALIRQPTLPQMGATPEMAKEDKLPNFPLARQDTSDTVATLPLYESRPPTRTGVQRQPTLPSIADDRPEMPSRMGTDWSTASYESDAPLLSNAGYAGGQGGRASPAPPPPAYTSRQNSNASFARPMPARTMTQGSQATQRSYAPVSRMDTMHSQQRAFSLMPGNGPVNSRPQPGQRFPVRSNTGFSFDTEQQSVVSPISPQDNYGRTMGPPSRQPTQESFRTAPMNRQDSQASTFNRPVYGSQHSQQRSFSRPMLAPQQASMASTMPISPPVEDSRHIATGDSYEMTRQAPYTATPNEPTYVAFNPSAYSNASTPAPQTSGAFLQPGPPRRNITVTGQPGSSNNYFGAVDNVPQRSATAPIDQRHTTGYGDIISDYGDSARNSISPPTMGARHNRAHQTYKMQFGKQRPAAQQAEDVSMEDAGQPTANFGVGGMADEVEMMNVEDAFKEGQAALVVVEKKKQAERAEELKRLQEQELVNSLAFLGLRTVTKSQRLATAQAQWVKGMNMYYHPKMDFEEATKQLMACLRAINLSARTWAHCWAPDTFRKFVRDREDKMKDFEQGLRWMSTFLSKGRKYWDFKWWSTSHLVEMEELLRQLVTCLEILSEYQECGWLGRDVLAGVSSMVVKVEELQA
ncbi:Potassium transporter [Elasticomyces elasticus]|nr:Potassium transporter [Elasticomyces elasticus]KAK3668175.1 Potassium transporter [Elasticomyces elasticus]KAK4921379.1 Potassium transporter [Elasticomyces elasticus]KAK5769498.1 Potassium transporter [Elasticomyces elasticus]